MSIDLATEYCRQKYSTVRWKEHIQYVLAASKTLLNFYPMADTEIVTLAVLFHDITKDDDRENHHLSWSKVAKEYLQRHQYNINIIEKVVWAISQHRWSIISQHSTIESAIVSNADAMAFFYNPITLFYSTFRRIDDFYDAKNRINEKIKSSYQKLSLPQAKELCSQEYHRLQSLMNSNYNYFFT